MEDVPLLELYEVLQINLVTPFILMAAIAAANEQTGQGGIYR